MNGLELLSSLEDKYSIIKPLGHGGTSDVYLAVLLEDPSKHVAIKVIPHGNAGSESKERAIREFNSLLNIESPYIVKPIEIIQRSSTTFCVMEYLGGGSLFDRMQRSERIPTERIVKILFEVAQGLSSTHEAGIVHRDVKPSNILFDSSETAHIADFGASRDVSHQSLTLEGFMVGTPKYLPPEYIETGESDARGDIYGLGVIGYELLIGYSPFGEKQGEELLFDRFRPVTMQRDRIPAETPEALVQIIEKCLKTSVSQRFQSAKELSEELLETGIWKPRQENDGSEKKLGLRAKLIQKLAVFQNLKGF